MADLKKGGALFPALFVGIGVLFVGILVLAYVGSRQANPVMLDEQGHVKGAH